MKNHKEHATPDNNGGGDQKRSVTGRVSVQGEIEVHFPTKIQEQEAAEKREAKTRDTLKLWIDSATLVVVIVYAALTFWQASSTQKLVTLTKDQFISDQRPFIWQTNKTTEGPTFRENPQNPGIGQIEWNWHMTNYGKSPGNNVRFTQEIKLEGSQFVLSHGEKGEDTGEPAMMGVDSFDTVISAPMPREEFNRLLRSTDGISIRVKIYYTGLNGYSYESGLCLWRTNVGSISYCKNDNYIK